MTTGEEAVVIKCDGDAVQELPFSTGEDLWPKFLQVLVGYVVQNDMVSNDH